MVTSETMEFLLSIVTILPLVNLRLREPSQTSAAKAEDPASTAAAIQKPECVRGFIFQDI
jgi:hypothetical protein